MSNVFTTVTDTLQTTARKVKTRVADIFFSGGIFEFETKKIDAPAPNVDNNTKSNEKEMAVFNLK